MKKTEILCTLGPSSMEPAIIRKLDDAGIDIFRLNLSHTGENDIEKNLLGIKRYTDKHICIDTEGAQIRTGFMKKNSVRYAEGKKVRIHRRQIVSDSSNLWLNPASVLDEFRPGDLISVDFDTVLLKVRSTGPDFVEAAVLCGGIAGNNKAVTVDREIALPPFSGKDLKAIKTGLKLKIEYVALSFAGCKEDVECLRKLTGNRMRIISKIESRRGLNNLDAIMSVSDAILIDRGDLSREESLEMIPFLQKEIIKRANAKGVPVYVATNLLESMVNRKLPTRSEVNDIINTLLDGADGLVLAAETAIGRYPVECVGMVRRVIKAYSMRSRGRPLKEIANSPRPSFILTEPHGGTLVNRLNPDRTNSSLKKLKRLVVDDHVITDAEQIAIGAYSPVEGFMKRGEIDSVLNDYRLPDGTVWTLPIVLQASAADIAHVRKGDEIALVLRKDGPVYATMGVEDIYKFDFSGIAGRWYGTVSLEHPGVRMLRDKGGYFLGGRIELLRRAVTGFEEFTLTPAQTRHIFEKKGWNTVVGFHTRNVIHRVHEYLQLAALENFNIDGLFVHPVVGAKKGSDFSAGIILKSYALMLEKFYPKNRVLLGAFHTYSRYAGPREAVFTALCRKNFGCTHFIVGRDHTGVGDFYKARDSRRLFEKLGDIGITPVFFNEFHYCRRCRKYVEKCSHDAGDMLKISGTHARQMLKSGLKPPEWFMRRDISDLVLKEGRAGNRVFVG